MNKRGQFSEVARIILLVVFALLIIFAVGRFIYFMNSQSAETLCTQGIIKSGLDGLPSFKCKAERITISKDGLESQADGKLDDEGLDDAVKRAIANEMYACWKTTGRGNVDPYKGSFESLSYGVQLAKASEDVFMICKIVSFRDIPDFEGLLFWLTVNKPQGGDEPYYDLIYDSKPSPEELSTLEVKDDTYDTDNTYVVVWRYSQKVPFYEMSQSIIFAPYDQLIQGRLSRYIGTGISGGFENSGGYYIPIVMN